jgi:hypothetical protein
MSDTQEIQKVAALREIAKTLQLILQELQSLRAGQMGKI